MCSQKKSIKLLLSYWKFFHGRHYRSIQGWTFSEYLHVLHGLIPKFQYRYIEPSSRRVNSSQQITHPEDGTLERDRNVGI